MTLTDALVGDLSDSERAYWGAGWAGPKKSKTNTTKEERKKEKD